MKKTSVTTRLRHGLVALLRGWAVVVATQVVTAPLPAAGGQVAPQEGFFRQHCFRCHDNKKQEGSFRIDTLSHDFADPLVAGRWAEVMTRINAGEMPPEEEPRPTSDEIGGVADWIESRLRAGEATRMAARGSVTFSRLSREEYAHTIYDLLGVRFDVTAPGVMSEDPAWHGFERIGSLLSLSPSHVERYLATADAIVKRAFPEKEPELKKTRRDAISLWSEQSRPGLAAKGLAEKVRVPWWPGFEGWHIHTGAGNGPARVRIQLSGLAPPGGRAPHLSVWDVVGKRSVYDTDVVAAENSPIVVDFVTLAPTILLMNEVPGKIGENKDGNSFFLTTRDHRLRHPRARKLIDDDGNALVPLLLVDWVEIETPVTTDAERQARAGLLPADFANEVEVRDSLHRFCERAWRRPVTDAEVDRYVQIAAAERKAGEPPRAAFLSAMAAVLASKNFLYLQEGPPQGGSRESGARGDRLDDWQLASRLSFFLWSSLPDEALFAAARAGRLHEPAVLNEQFTRMLADQKNGRFMESFPRQWLQLQKVGMFPPDRGLYPDYDRWLEKSMVLETQGFFGELLAKNLPLVECLVADWTILNPRLAEHYRLPRPAESGFSRVSLPADSHRGGLLTQAAVLSLTSDGSRHRPVHRGAWVLETILGTTPPPPPPNVEPLEPTPKDASKMTVRMQLADHATNATCASCHRKIDPLGFAFDNYDAVGRWRTVEKVTAGKGDDPPVDASGTLEATVVPSGTAVPGLPESGKFTVPQQLTIDRSTRLWRGRESIGWEDLAPEAEWKSINQGTKELVPTDMVVQLALAWHSNWQQLSFHVSDIWLDEESRQVAAERQRQRHVRRERSYWLPGWVDHVDHEKNIVTVTLFGGRDRSLFDAVRAMATPHGGISIEAATKTLRTWHVNYGGHANGGVVEVKDLPAPPVGSSGMQVRVRVGVVQEGFRPGRIVRIAPNSFGNPWPPPEWRARGLDD